MKKHGLLGLIVLLVFAIVSCNNGGDNTSNNAGNDAGNKEEALTKYIPANRIVMKGNHANRFKITADSVKVMLIPVGVEGKQWEVRTILPFGNTTPWSEIPGSNDELDTFIYGPDIIVGYIDSYDSKLNLSVEEDYEIAKEVLKSEDLISKDMPLSVRLCDKLYDVQKAYFDKIDGVEMLIDMSWASR